MLFKLFNGIDMLLIIINLGINCEYIKKVIWLFVKIFFNLFGFKLLFKNRIYNLSKIIIDRNEKKIVVLFFK